MTVPEHLIDLSLEPEKRFVEVGEIYAKELRSLLRRTRKELLSGVKPAVRTLIERIADKGASYLTSELADHPYVRELNGLAEAAGVEVEDLYLGNLVYDITSRTGSLGIGCTGLVHGGPPNPLIARCMDWAIPSGIGKLSAVFRFKNGEHEFLSVGFPGVTGVISGLSSRGFAITVNQRFQLTIPRIEMPVLWMVREILENATSYDSARRLLARAPALSPAFYLLCGTKPGEACLVQSDGSEDAVTRVPSGASQCISNHVLAEESEDEQGGSWWSWGDDEEEDEEIEAGDSVDRYEALTRRAAKLTTADPNAAMKSLGRYPVTNPDTVHQMVLVPATGVLHLRCPYRRKKAYSAFCVGVASEHDS